MGVQTTPENGLIDSHSMTQRPFLTNREREIAALVRAGLANKVIALRLGVSEGTVKSHLNHVYRKLGVRNRVALIIDAG
jgi:DNA-binding NarL/FixJ family response regulator